MTAHPDDLETGCGGLVAKILANGGAVTNLIMVKPSAEQNPNRDQQTVSTELEKSKQTLGFELKVYDTPLHANGRPNLTLDNNLITFVESCVENHDVLITHWREDYHQDHRICYEAGRSVARKTFKSFWCMDQPPYNLHYANFNCNQYVDITDYIEVKKEALESYASYFLPQDIEHIINYNKYRGGFLGKNKIAETFHIIYNKE